jgi:ribonuclease HI
VTVKRAEEVVLGSCLIFKNSLPFTRIDIPYNPFVEVVAVKINDIGYVSIYIPPNAGFDNGYWNTVISLLPESYILMGDWNSKNAAWGCSSSDRSGNRLLSFIDDNCLVILNDGSPTRLAPPGQNSNALDISLCTSDLACSIDWNVSQDAFSSDHYPIFLTIHIKLPSQYTANCRKCYNVYKADWEKFKSTIETILSNDYPDICEGGIEQNYRDITNILYLAADASIPLNKSSNKPIKSRPWWDPECDEAIRKRKEAMREYKKSRTDENFLNAKKFQAKAKKLLRKKKREGWQKFCSSLSPNSHPSNVWRMIRCFKGSMTPSRGRAPTELWLSDFSRMIAPPYVPNKPQMLQETVRAYVPISVGLDSPFSIEELKICLHKVKNSAPGLDRIPYLFLKKSPDTLLACLVKLFNQILTEGTIPEEWSEQLIIPIPKPGKDPSRGASYRPIALSSCVSKMFEHLIKNRLEWFLEHYQLLTHSQFGFRKSLCCFDNLSILVTDVLTSYSHKEFTVSAFLDITAAYDNVDIHILYLKLLKLSVPSVVAKIIYKLFYERTLVIMDGPEENRRKIWKGIPQGSVLSPILFNVYCSDLERKINKSCKIVQFADDLAIYTSHKNINMAERQLTDSLEILNKWLKTNHLELSPTKSNIMVFSRKHINPTVSVVLEGTSIAQTNEIKFLGALIDRKLSWHSHINFTISKCEKSINMLRAISSVAWGSHPSTMTNMYNAMVRSHLDYASFLFDPLPRYLEDKLERIQSKCLRLILGAFPSTPINSLQVESGEMPLSIRRFYLAKRFILKRISYFDHPLFRNIIQLNNISKNSSFWTRKATPMLCRGFSLILSNFKDTRYPYPSPTYSAPLEALQSQPDIVDNIGFTKNNKVSEIQINQEFNSIIDQKWPSHIKIFTDGSKLCKNGNSGSAVFIPELNLQTMFMLPPEASVYTAECFAMKEALHMISKFHNSNSFLILSDSLSLVQTLASPTSWFSRNTHILEIKKLLFKHKRNEKQITIAWIPSHFGIRGNEKVDGLAKLATSSGQIPHHFILPESDTLRILSEDAIRQWTIAWKETCINKGSYYASIQDHIPANPWFKKKNMNRSLVSTICRMRFGHHRLDSHLYKLGLVYSPICECGLDDETLNHVLFACPLRDRCVLYHRIPDVEYPLSVEYLLSLGSVDIYRLLYKFIKENIVII